MMPMLRKDIQEKGFQLGRKTKHTQKLFLAITQCRYLSFLPCLEEQYWHVVSNPMLH